VQVFQGQLVQEQVPVEISLYPSESLKRISKDGKFFEDHLLYTTKLQTFLNQQHPDLFCRIHAIYSRKIGIDPKDRDLYVFYEVLGPDWVNFKDYISSTGGLVKIPFLVTSNSLFHVIKYWFQKILAIVDVVNQNSASCYIISPDNFYVNHKTLELRMKSLSGACQIHFDGTLSNISDLNLVLPTPTHVPEAQLQSFNVSEQFISNPYLAPEIFYTEVTDRTPFADSWSLGAILYFLIFGEDPKAIFSEFKEKDATSMKEPSDFVYYNLFDDRLVNEILQHDFGLKVDPTDNLIERSIRLKSFEGVFSRVNKEFNPQMLQSNSLNTQYSLGNFLDMLVLLMSWKPHRRPTARALLFSPLMKTDKYEEMQMRQFSSLSFFYRSPSKCVRNDVLLPLRAMCLTAIKKPKKAVLLTEDIMKVIDRIYAFTGSTESHVFANVNEEFSKSKQGPAELSSWHLLDSITQKMRTGEQKRLKAPNCCLIKFVFEHFILDILLFLVLRHHGAVNEALGAEELPAQKLEDHYYKPVKGFAAIMKRIVCDLQSYESASAPFVGSVIDLIVKFTVSEEFVLASDIIDDLEEEANLLIQTNTIDEYFQLQTSKTSILRNGRFFSTPKDEIDLLDRAWTESLSKKPYCFWSNNWSFYQCTLSTSLMKEAFGEAGLGSSNHPVLMDYNRFVQGLMKKPKFEAENTMNYINNLLKGAIVKTVDYFSEILILGSNMITLEDPNSGTTSLKVVINYVATILKSKNVDKVRAVLDSRIVLKCINFLQSENAQLKESILELIFEATKSFTRDHLYLYEQYDVNSKFDSIMDTKPRTADEVQKNFGLVSHLALTNEDKMNKSNYINCVRNYFDLNAKISEKYIRQISMAVAVPSFFVCLTTIIKTNTDLLRSKTFALDIIYNLTNAPFNVVRNFSHSSIDTLNTLAKIFVIKRSGKKNKVNEYLLPYSLKIFKNLVLDGRREILKMLENAVGLRTLLRDQQLVIPKRQTLATLAGKIDEVDVYYKNHFKDMMLEANQIMINRYTGLGASRVKAYHLTHFEELLRDCCVKIVCWLEFESNKTSEYSVSMLQDIIYRFIENIKYYFETFMEHYQTNETITACMLCISNFIETVCNQGFEYMVFDTVDTTRGLSNTEWVMLQVYSIYNFHQILGLEEKPEEGEKLLEHKINQIADLEERGRELSKFISNSACLTKYTTCRIAQAAHSFLRVLMLLLERDDPEYTALLEASHFVHFYSSLIQKQHALLQMFIRTKTESIHVIGVTSFHPALRRGI
jgi:hypothetical protein